MRAGVAQVLAAHAPRLAVTRWYYGSPQRLSLSTGVATATRAASLRGGDFLRFAEPNGNGRNESASATAITPVVSTQGGLDETALELEEKAHSSPIAHVSARAGPLAGACVGPELVISPVHVCAACPGIQLYCLPALCILEGHDHCLGLGRGTERLIKCSDYNLLSSCLHYFEIKCRNCVPLLLLLRLPALVKTGAMGATSLPRTQKAV